MVDAIKINNLRNNDYSQFLQNVLSVLERYDPATLMIAVEFNKLKAVSETIKNMLNETTANAITEELTMYDSRRDEAISGILALVNAYTYSDDVEMKKAANVLSVHLAGFGTAIARESYQNETSKMQKIIQDWNVRPELTAAVSKLGLEKWKTAMEAANTAFDTRYVDRAVENGTTNQDKVYDKRPEANAVYYELREQLNAWYVIKRKAEPFATAINAVNGVIRDYNALVAGRKPVGIEGTIVNNTVAS